ENSPARPPDLDASGAVPDLAALRGRATIPLSTARVEAGLESRIELREQPVGYIRARIKPLPGHQAEGDFVNGYVDFRTIGAVRFEGPGSGEFFHGPLLPGKVTYLFTELAEDGSSRAAGKQAVEVRGGEAVEIELHPEGPQPAAGPEAG